MPALHIDPGPSPPSLLSMQAPLTLRRGGGGRRGPRRERGLYKGARSTEGLLGDCLHHEPKRNEGVIAEVWVLSCLAVVLLL